MNSKKSTDMVHSGVKKIASTILTQGIILTLSFVTGLILPDCMGPEMYGYWQIYVLYLAYLNLFGIGFSDGMALYYGGKKYEDLPFRRIRGAIVLVAVFVLIITCGLFLMAGFIKSEASRYIYQMLALNIPLSCISATVMSTMSAVNRTGVYNGLNLLLRILTVAAYVILIMTVHTDYKSMILGDIIARLLLGVVCLWIGKNLFFGKKASRSESFAELKEKSSAGINITLAAIVAGILPVAGKFVVQFAATVVEFGEYSFGMSLLHIVITFTSAAGLVIYPLLKSMDNEKLAKYYPELSNICSVLVFAAMFMYLPLRWIIIYFLPEYQAVLSYLHIMLLICVPMGRLQLMMLPYFKAMRLEKSYFVANIIGVVAMIGITWLTYQISQLVWAVALASTAVYTIWSICLEYHLVRSMKCITSFWKKKIIDIVLMLVFILASSSGKWFLFISIYGAAFIGYLLWHSKSIKTLKVLISKK